MPYEPYIPQDIYELLDKVSYVMLASPTFEDTTGYFPERNIDTAFWGLNGGLLAVRKELGEERYTKLRAMSDKMRAFFEADPEDKTGDTRAGLKLVREMQDILETVAKQVAMRGVTPERDD